MRADGRWSNLEAAALLLLFKRHMTLLIAASDERNQRLADIARHTTEIVAFQSSCILQRLPASIAPSRMLTVLCETLKQSEYQLILCL